MSRSTTSGRRSGLSGAGSDEYFRPCAKQQGSLASAAIKLGAASASSCVLRCVRRASSRSVSGMAPRANANSACLRTVDARCNLLAELPEHASRLLRASAASRSCSIPGVAQGALNDELGLTTARTVREIYALIVVAERQGNLHAQFDHTIGHAGVVVERSPGRIKLARGEGAVNRCPCGFDTCLPARTSPRACNGGVSAAVGLSPRGSGRFGQMTALLRAATGSCLRTNVLSASSARSRSTVADCRSAATRSLSISTRSASCAEQVTSITAAVGSSCCLLRDCCRIAHQPHPFARARPVEIVALCDQHLLQGGLLRCQPGWRRVPVQRRGFGAERLSPRSQVQSIPIDLSIRLRPSGSPGPRPFCKSICDSLPDSVGNGAWSALVTSASALPFGLRADWRTSKTGIHGAQHILQAGFGNCRTTGERNQQGRQRRYPGKSTVSYR